MEEKAEKIKKELMEDGMFSDLVNAGLIDEQGMRISGQGVVIKKLERLAELVDKTNLKLWKVEQELIKLQNK